MEQKQRFVSLAATGRFTLTELCADLHVSRKTGHKWLRRYGQLGSLGLQERSRRPHGCAHRTAEQIERLVLRERRRHRTWGPKKLRRLLRRDHRLRRPPACSTIAAILRRHGLSQRMRRAAGTYELPHRELTVPSLSDGMKWLQGTWIRRYNALRRLIGRPFQGRYKALHVEPGHALAQVCAYIHLNPVRAELRRPDAVAGYPWSSLPRFSAKDRPGWLEAGTILAEAGGLADTPAGWRRYASYLAFLAEDEPAKKALRAEKLSRGWCVGTAEFKRELRQQAARRGAELDRFARLDPAEAQVERRAGWEEQLVAFAARAKIDLTRLPGKKSEPGKVLLAAAMKRTTSVSNGWLAERLGMGEPASASQFVRRLLLTEEGQAAVARLLAREV